MGDIDLENLISYCKNLRLLYVEDDAITKKTTLDILGDFFDFIDVASDGHDGYEMFTDAEICLPSMCKLDQNNLSKQKTLAFGKYDLIITDLNMPRLDGIEMISKIRKISKDIPIIVLSAYNHEHYFLDTIKLGVNGYVLKPIDMTQLINSFWSVCELLIFKERNEAHKNRLQQTIELQQYALEDYFFTDELTKLPNKNALDKALHVMRESDVPSLFLINIDNFKNYNKLYGLDIGNEILKRFSHCAERVAKELKYDIFRISSDEFIMLHVSPLLDRDKLYEDIVYTLEILNGIELKADNVDEKVLVHISMGVTYDQENLFNKAFTALDCAKKSNKKFVVYTSNLDETKSLANDFYWQEVIADTLGEDNVVPFFQPICDTEKNIIKYEALIRIQSQDKIGCEKFIAPYYFLDISRRTKQYDSLSITMIEKVFEKVCEFPLMTFSINLGYRDVVNKQLRDLLKDKFLAAKLENRPCNVVFEILESEKIDNYALFKDFFHYIKCENPQIAIDDFGTGYSNFSHILELNPAYLKIDGSLIKNIDIDDKAFTIVKALVSFAKALHVKTIAEFVHKEEIFNMLLAIGVDEFQGYYIGEPSLEL